MGVLKRVNGGIGQGVRSMGCIDKGQWVYVRVGVNGGIDKD